MNKLERARAKKESEAKKRVGFIEFDSTEQVEAIHSVQKSVDKLSEVLANKEDYNPEELQKFFSELTVKIDNALELLGQRTENLGQAFDSLKIPEFPEELEIKGLKHLAETIKAQSQLGEVISGYARTNDLQTQTIIAAPATGKLVISDIIIANTSGADSHLVIKDGESFRLFYPAPMKGGAIHALKTALVLEPGSPLRFAALTPVDSLIVSAVGTVNIK